jgi:hypothetical protein
LKILTTTGAIAVNLWDQSRSGQEISKPLPYLGSACHPQQVARNQYKYNSISRSHYIKAAKIPPNMNPNSKNTFEIKDYFKFIKNQSITA